MRVERLPSPGETLLGTGYRVDYGGKGSNQAVGCARLGARVSFVARIGKDAFGEMAPGRPLPGSILQLVDILTPNQSEARVLAGRSPDDAIDPEDVARELIGRGVKQVVMTLGE